MESIDTNTLPGRTEVLAIRTKKLPESSDFWSGNWRKQAKLALWQRFKNYSNTRWSNSSADRFLNAGHQKFSTQCTVSSRAAVCRAVVRAVCWAIWSRAGAPLTKRERTACQVDCCPNSPVTCVHFRFRNFGREFWQRILAEWKRNMFHFTMTSGHLGCRACWTMPGEWALPLFQRALSSAVLLNCSELFWIVLNCAHLQVLHYNHPIVATGDPTKVLCNSHWCLSGRTPKCDRIVLTSGPLPVKELSLCNRRLQWQSICHRPERFTSQILWPNDRAIVQGDPNK